MMRSAFERRRLLCVAAVVLAAAGAQAQPQKQQSSAPPNALQGFSQNRNQPVKINASSLDVRDHSKIATFSGNVHLVQGDTTLRCKVLVVHYDGDQTTAGPKASMPGANTGNSSISHMEAIGDVIVTQKEQTATGAKAVYDMKQDTVTLLAAPGSFVAVTQGVNIVRSDKSLIVHLASGVSHFDGRVEALITPSAAKGETKGEVKGETKGETGRSSTSESKAPPRAAPARAQQGHPQGLY